MAASGARHGHGSWRQRSGNQSFAISKYRTEEETSDTWPGREDVQDSLA